MNHPLVVAITGASGAVFAVRLLDLLCRQRDVHLSISPAGQAVLLQELAVDINLKQPSGRELLAKMTASDRYRQLVPSVFSDPPGEITYHDHRDFLSPIASGSFLTGGMVVCPCSGSTLSAVVTGASSNLIHRAVDVHLKEKRRLVLVPRETPVSLIHLNNMQRASEAGAVVLPATPGWYHGVQHIQDLVDFIVAKILDHLGVANSLIHRWGSQTMVGQPDAR